MYRSYSINDMPEPVRLRNEEKNKKDEESKKVNERCNDIIERECEEEKYIEECRTKNKGFLSDLKIDDIIILVVILLLVMDNCEDKLLIIALGFLLFSDFFEF